MVRGFCVPLYYFALYLLLPFYFPDGDINGG
jgi:hypothetical protein